MKVTVEEYLQAVDIVNRYLVQQAQIEAIKNLDKTEEQKRLEMIFKTVQQMKESYGIDNSRKRDVVQMRQAMMYWLRNNTTLSLHKIGEMFGRDHATVLHATLVARQAVKFKDYAFINNAEIVYNRLAPFKKKSKNESGKCEAA
jgi:chromosomal replication initiation ATPase DnaA